MPRYWHDAVPDTVIAVGTDDNVDAVSQSVGIAAMIVSRPGHASEA